jgi:hypothetical protein
MSADPALALGVIDDAGYPITDRAAARRPT